MLVALAGAFLIGRCNISKAGAEGQLEQGTDALVRAIAGERAAFGEAEKAFLRAAGTAVFDGYPLFMAELTRAIAEGRVEIAHVDARPIVTALARGDFDAAVAGLPHVPRDFVGRENLERAVVDLARRAAERSRE